MKKKYIILSALSIMLLISMPSHAMEAAGNKSRSPAFAEATERAQTDFAEDRSSRPSGIVLTTTEVIAQQSYRGTTDRQLAQQTGILDIEELGEKLMSLLVLFNDEAGVHTLLQSACDAGITSDQMLTLLNHANKYGDTTLTWAVSCRNPQIVRVLLDAARNAHMTQGQMLTLLNHANENGWTALILAATGNTQVVQVLLDVARDAHLTQDQMLTLLNHADKNGNTPLITAAQWGKIHHVQALLDAARSMDQDIYITQDVLRRTNNKGKNALMMAIEESHLVPVPQNKRIETVELLLAAADWHNEEEGGAAPEEERFARRRWKKDDKESHYINQGKLPELEEESEG